MGEGHDCESAIRLHPDTRRLTQHGVAAGSRDRTEVRMPRQAYLVGDELAVSGILRVHGLADPIQHYMDRALASARKT